jgi:hypothetical protein
MPPCQTGFSRACATLKVFFQLHAEVKIKQYAMYKYPKNKASCVCVWQPTTGDDLHVAAASFTSLHPFIADFYFNKGTKAHT